MCISLPSKWKIFAHSQFFLVNNSSETWLFSQETKALHVAIKPLKGKFSDRPCFLKKNTLTAWSPRGGFPRDLCEWPQHSLLEPDCWEDGSRISWDGKEMILEMPARLGMWVVATGMRETGWGGRCRRSTPMVPSLGIDLDGRWGLLSTFHTQTQ